uniref:C6 domain-containing protein n=1 Tax=Globodera pallida TaxID=36090 RepID=A0A183CB46_GLOPA
MSINGRESDRHKNVLVSPTPLTLAIMVPVYLTMLPYAMLYACLTTSTVPTPGPGCCPPLNQTLSPSTAFADGVLTFVYDSNLCRTLVTANCSQPNPTLELNAAIVVNTNNFLVVGPRNVTFAGVCGANRSWQMGNPPLAVQNIECLLTNPTGG